MFENIDTKTSCAIVNKQKKKNFLCFNDPALRSYPIM